MKKKIVQIVRSPAGGIRKHIVSIIENLDSELEVYLILDNSDADSKYDDFINKNPEFINNILNLTIVEKPSFGDIRNVMSIYRFVQKNKIDILHGHGAKGGAYARLVAFFLGKKSIYTSHGGSLHSMHGTIKNAMYVSIEKILYYMSSKLIFESKYSMNEYGQRVHKYSNKFELNYNGITIPSNFQSLAVKSIDKNNTVFLAAFGLLRNIKGHDLLIKAVKLLVDDGYKIQLDLYGEGEEKVNLESLIRILNLDEIVNLHGFVDDISAPMKKCSIVVHPSLFESFGYVPIEAFIHGNTVVSSLNGGLREVMDNGKVGFCPDKLTVEGLYEQIKEAIENKKEREDKFELAKILIIENFSQDKFIKNINNIYSEL